MRSAILLVVSLGLLASSVASAQSIPGEYVPVPRAAPSQPDEAAPPAAVPPGDGKPREAEKPPDAGIEGTEGEAATTEAAARRLLVGEDADLRLRVRIQPRFDYGELGDVKSRDGQSYATERDMYMRRIRAAFTGTVLKQFRYAVTFQGDRVNQTGRANQVKISDALVDWHIADELELRVGKSKLPITRIGLTSSARQLFIERPAFIEAARGDLFQDSNQMNFGARGRLLDGAVAWYGAVTDAWNVGDKLYASGKGTTVRDSGLAWVGRLELSPPGWAERHKSDSHVGSGKHLTAAASVGMQEKIEYADVAGQESRRLLGWDVSGHYGPLTAQVEGTWWHIRSTTRGVVRPRGWYAQVAMYVAPLHLEPAVRYEDFREDMERPDVRQQAYSAGLNAYVLKHSLKLQVAFVHRLLGAKDPLRLARDDAMNLVQVQAQLYL